MESFSVHHPVWHYLSYVMTSASTGVISGAAFFGLTGGNFKMVALAAVLIGIVSLIVSLIPGFSILALGYALVGASQNPPSEYDQTGNALILFGSIPSVVIGALVLAGLATPTLRSGVGHQVLRGVLVSIPLFFIFDKVTS